MQLNTIQEIERAIDGLTPEQIQELYLWLDQHHPHSVDARLQSDLAAGRLDTAIQRALEDEEAGRTRPL
jgi:hypothetical protein